MPLTTTNQNYNNYINTYRIISPVTDDIQKVSSPFTFSAGNQAKKMLKDTSKMLPYYLIIIAFIHVNAYKCD